MATPEHCIYCFESLAAKLEDRDGLSLADVQKSYAAYLASQTDDATASSSTTKKIPALRRLVGSPDSGPASGSSSSTSLSDNTTLSSISSSSTSSSAATQARARVTDPDACYPLFVTWDKRQGPAGSAAAADWHLRGCIGTFSAADPLAAALAEYAVISALHDTRFPRVAARELPQLRCAVTLLTGFEDCAGVDDWTVGEHGIRIAFTWQGRRYGATYLPSVAPEQGWDREQTMVSLMRKAGWEGRRTAWREVAEKSGMRVERYRGDKEEVEYAEYKAWKDWVDKNWDGAEGEDDDEDDDED